MRVLVVAAPRSGTRAFAALLRGMGLDTGHERLGPDACVSSYFAVDADRYHGPHERRQERRGNVVADQVWHLVRHPLDTIGSIASRMSPRWWRWQEPHTGVSPEISEPERAARFWVRWMEKIEADPAVSWRIRIEDANDLREEIARRLRADRIGDAVSTDIGDTRGAKRAELFHVELTTAAQIEKRAAEYGYTL